MARKKNKQQDDKPMIQATWYDVRALSDGVLDINIFDEIGWMGVTASEFIREIQNAKPDKIMLRVNSPGGDVFQGLAMYNFLNELDAEIECTVEGIAASIASIVIQAADSISIPANAFIMVHEPFVGLSGNRGELRKAADQLDKITDSMRSIYEEATGLESNEVSAIMENETWLNGSEAVEKGFATDLVGAQAIAASFNIKKLREVPAEVKGLFIQHSEEKTEMKDEPKDEQKVENADESKKVDTQSSPEPQAKAEDGKPEGDDLVPVPAAKEEEGKADDGRGEFRAFQDLFGAKAGDYFAKGMTLEEAKDAHIKAQADEIKALQDQKAAAKTSSDDGNDPAAFDGSDNAKVIKPKMTLKQCKEYCKKTGGDAQALYDSYVAQAKEEEENQ